MQDLAALGAVAARQAFPSGSDWTNIIGNPATMPASTNAAPWHPDNRATASGRMTTPSRLPTLLVQCARLGLLAAMIALPQPAAAQGANFLGEPVSGEARQVADWVVTSRDNRNMPFVIIDKVNAKVFLFTDHGQLRRASRALLGLARGDDSVPGIGDRKMSSIRPEERTTPAGRFVASLGHNAGDHDILWVDYADAISLHRVITSNPKEQRAQRLATASSLDKRISYGCINVPPEFFDKFIIPAFKGTNGIVYIMPETRSPREVFAGFSG